MGRGYYRHWTRVELAERQTGHGLAQFADPRVVTVRDGVPQADVVVQLEDVVPQANVVVQLEDVVPRADVVVQLEDVELVVTGGTFGQQQLKSGVRRVARRQSAFLPTVCFVTTTPTGESIASK